MSENEAYISFIFKKKSPIELKPFLPKYYSTKSTCKYCNKEVEEHQCAVYSAYWYPHTKFIAHKECLIVQQKEEAYECQKIDANCNDCKYFDRTKSTDDIQDFSISMFPKITTTIGFCNKHQCSTRASSCSFQGNTCFVHRKD